MAIDRGKINGDPPQPRTTWREVRGPCPICRHTGWCRLSPDGAMVACRRTDQGAIRRLDYRDGTAWLHALGGRRDFEAPPLPPPKPAVPCAADDDLDRVYRALLACPELRLVRDHRDQLIRRGLSTENIDRDGYRSLPAVCRASVGRRLRERFPDPLLLATPGVVGRDGRHGRYLTVSGLAGLVVPIRSAAGLLVGLVVRPDERGTGGKYRWLSSSRQGGPAARSRVHVPASTKPTPRAGRGEGSLKANVAAALSRRVVIGLPGCNLGDEAIETLRTLGVEKPLLALDADAPENYHVALAQVEGLRRLKEAGFDAGVIRWSLDLGKGLDDALLAHLSRRAAT